MERRPFGPPVRDAFTFAEKLSIAKQLGFDAMQFHDDDAVPNLDSLSPSQISSAARAMKQMLADQGLVAEFVAPRLWENPRTIDGAYTLPMTRPSAPTRWNGPSKPSISLMSSIAI